VRCDGLLDDFAALLLFNQGFLFIMGKSLVGHQLHFQAGGKALDVVEHARLASLLEGLAVFIAVTLSRVVVGHVADTLTFLHRVILCDF